MIDLWMCLIINAFCVIHCAFMVHSWCNTCCYFLLFCCCAGAGALLLLLLLLLLVRCCGCCCCAGAAAALLLCAFCAHSLRILCALSAHCLCAFCAHSLCILCAFCAHSLCNGLKSAVINLQEIRLLSVTGLQEHPSAWEGGCKFEHSIAGTENVENVGKTHLWARIMLRMLAKLNCGHREC